MLGGAGHLTAATMASLGVPDLTGVASWGRVVSDISDQRFLVTITGGNGPVSLMFWAEVSGFDYTGVSQDPPGSEYVGIHSSVYATSPDSGNTVRLEPAWWNNVHAPSSCYLWECGSIDFVYGRPQVVRIQESTIVEYSWNVNASPYRPIFSGTVFTGHSYYSIAGAYDMETGLKSDAVISMTPIPEPGTISGMIVAALVLAAVALPRGLKRHDLRLYLRTRNSQPHQRNW